MFVGSYIFNPWCNWVFYGSDVECNRRVEKEIEKRINDFSVEAGMKWIKIEGEESNYYLGHGLSVAMEKVKGLYNFRRNKI